MPKNLVSGIWLALYPGLVTRLGYGWDKSGESAIMSQRERSLKGLLKLYIERRMYIYKNIYCRDMQRT